jgi:guanylate cyclase
VEPHQIILITEFCDKGALQDILENQDIKLEMMFLASLTNDLGIYQLETQIVLKFCKT